MKSFIILLFTLILINMPIFANTVTKNYASYPQGTFKKNWKGEIVQYDKNGKKISKFKSTNIKYRKIK